MFNEAQIQQEVDKKNKKIADLVSDIEYRDTESGERYDKLLASKKEMERMNNDRLQQMMAKHEIEVERRRQDYQDKMDADT